ncbi:hypothetical protein L208DRAFT_1417708 [Tricholoma matsutake]|nr:hypothetical protein L208DRAFT_1417708 [Tricholoma matsutake 945]
MSSKCIRIEPFLSILFLLDCMPQTFHIICCEIYLSHTVLGGIHLCYIVSAVYPYQL